ncbi:MAG: hypothetical protein PHU34_12155 [Candidatus Methanoperedens sp.]|nr:hypothetical protein [Candidatus Methanoperedens sp.]
MIEPEVALSNLLREYKENSDARNTAIESTLTQIDALSSYMDGLAAPYDQILNELQGKIQAIMFERKERFICESGKVTYFKGGVKRSWDLDALDNTCKFDLYVKQTIWMHRKEAPFDPRIQIKVEV